VAVGCFDCAKVRKDRGAGGGAGGHGGGAGSGGIRPAISGTTSW
jgi:hypothetical protein